MIHKYLKEILAMHIQGRGNRSEEIPRPWQQATEESGGVYSQ